MVGQLRSLPLTFLGALILGESENILYYIDTKGIGGETISNLAGNLQPSMPVILLFLVLVFMPGDQARFHLNSLRDRIPKPKLRTMVIAMGAYIVVAGFLSASGWVSDPTLTSSARASPSAPCSRWCCSPAMPARCRWPSWRSQASRRSACPSGGRVVGVPGGIVLTAVVGVLVALPALRLRGLYLSRRPPWPSCLFLEQSVYGNMPLHVQLFALETLPRIAYRASVATPRCSSPWPWPSRRWRSCSR